MSTTTVAMKQEIDRFAGTHDFLSNFHPCGILHLVAPEGNVAE